MNVWFVSRIIFQMQQQPGLNDHGFPSKPILPQTVIYVMMTEGPTSSSISEFETFVGLRSKYAS